MAAIKARDTKPEIIVRKYLWKNGFRYRLNHRHLPGKPDVVLRMYRTCIFVNGCFWHGHYLPAAEVKSEKLKVKNCLPDASHADESLIEAEVKSEKLKVKNCQADESHTDASLTEAEVKSEKLKVKNCHADESHADASLIEAEVKSEKLKVKNCQADECHTEAEVKSEKLKVKNCQADESQADESEGALKPCCKIPKTNTDFWLNKIRRNQERDVEVQHKLARMGWHCITIWECELKPDRREKTLQSLIYTLSQIYLQDRQPRKYRLDEEGPQRLVADKSSPR